MFSKLKHQLKKTTKTPFVNKKCRQLIIHCGHHKMGTTWVAKILNEFANEYSLKFQYADRENEPLGDTDIFLQSHSRINLQKLKSYIGSHMIRDPRDIIVSGYFYHLWTKEEWVHIPMKNLSHKWKYLPTEECGHMSYQEYLNSISQEEGILAEIKKAPNTDMKEMIEWDYKNPSFLEIKYEDLIEDEESIFYSIFKHYGLNEAAIDTCLKIAKKHSFKNTTNRKIGEVKLKSHLRSGRPGEWKELFGEEHKREFKNLLGDVVVKLGYEVNNTW
jgi:hypothetical protein